MDAVRGKKLGKWERGRRKTGVGGPYRSVDLSGQLSPCPPISSLALSFCRHWIVNSLRAGLSDFLLLSGLLRCTTLADGSGGPQIFVVNLPVPGPLQGEELIPFFTQLFKIP